MLCRSKESLVAGKLIILEGNIGVGKTTLSQELSSRLSYKVVFEPTAKNPYLSQFYENPKKFALKLQLWIYRQRYLTFVSAVQHIIETGQGVILDRSVFSDRVFAVVNRDDQNICAEGFRFYEELRLQSLRAMPIPHITIFLNADPALCSERISRRGRGCESGIPVEYLASLHTQYHAFLKEMSALGSTVLTFDWTSYGLTQTVADAVVKAETHVWTPEQIQKFKDFIRNPSAVTEALTMPWTFADAIIDEEAGGDNSAEAAMLAREQAVKPLGQAPPVRG